jgi:pyridoxamine 5'-phosphate oxidase
MRKQYQREWINEHNLPDDPLSLFGHWFEQAVAHEHEANAVVLATSSQNKPSARVVLLKEFGNEGFVFYTNYESKKGRQLTDNPNAAMVFYWPTMERQVRIEGKVERLSRKESEAYFDSRPDGSKLSAIISPQSQPIASRSELEQLAETLLRSGQALNMPDYWGGYRLIPESIEFWQGRPNRLHDRIHYSLVALGKWQRMRLAP